jgi:hypothetical protein
VMAEVSPFHQSPPVAFIRPDFSSSDDARLGGFVTLGKYFPYHYNFYRL